MLAQITDLHGYYLRRSSFYTGTTDYGPIGFEKYPGYPCRVFFIEDLIFHKTIEQLFFSEGFDYEGR
jgi:hypothetical protein